MAKMKVQLVDGIKRVVFIDTEATKGAVIGTNLYMPGGQLATGALLRAFIGVSENGSVATQHSQLQGLDANDHPQYLLGSTFAAFQATLADVAFSGDYNDLINQPTFSSTLDGLTDVNVYGAADGDVLTYDSYLNLWVAQAPTSPAGPSAAGRHGIWIAAGAMLPSATGGCQALQNVASAANQPDLTTLNFDATTQEYAQFSIRMPKAWDEGFITFAPVWSHPATTTNFGVVWDLQAVAVSDDDQIPVAFGTAVTSTDTGGTTNDLYVGPESLALTVGGTPQAEDLVFFRVSRVTGNASDTMAVDARLHGITIYITTDAETDA